MESLEEAKASQKDCVKVAVNIRPLITTELLIGCADCVTVVPGEPQVQIGSHSFTYDHVYGSSGSPSSLIFEECVLPLIDALFRGYNATVLAYGQTGSGKTYTMGTNYTGEDNSRGIIPQVMETIFKKVDTMKDTTEFLIRVSFIEIFKEEVFDLLDPQPHAALRAENASLAKPAAPSRVPIQIRETANGGITLAGVTEAEVRSKEEMASYLTRGSLSRATGSTNMNSQSSRSHAIFTICMEQKKIANNPCSGAINNDVGDDILIAKLHLVDLAGSERAKRTGADGLRLKEGIHINKGLLSLGNVISALGDEKKRKEGGHVPYRDSKLTRLLQDSLGGNSKTVMIACISPADSNAEETINTLKYANRARNIQNKAVINRDPVAAEMQRMRSQLEQLQAELLFCRGGGAPLEELQILRHKISLLEASNTDLRQELKECQITCKRLSQQAIDAQVEKDKLVLKIESARSGKPWDEIDKMDKTQELDLVKGYVSKIQELEAELLRVQNFSSPCGNGFMDHLALDDTSSAYVWYYAIGFTLVKKMLFLFDLYVNISMLQRLTPFSGVGVYTPAEAEEEKEREHTTLQDKLDKELQELDKRLEQKEFAKSDTSVLKQHYERKLLELEHEKRALQKEIEVLKFNLASISSTSDEGAQKLKEDYLQKLNMLEAQVSELKKKQEAQSQLLRQKQKSDEAAKRLHEEIQRIKSQKVQLQQKIKQESEQFRSWKASREKEVLQLKKEGRRNEYEMHKLLALNQRQKMRKTEEAALATKRLKELLEAKKFSSRDASGPGNGNGPGIQALVQAIEHELEVTVRVHEVRSEYERQMQERAAMANEVLRLKEESEMFKQKIMSDCPQAMSPSARNSRISALENMLATSSSTLISMASQLSEAEERERVFSGRGRWNQVRSLAEAKNLMNYLFNLVSSSRRAAMANEVLRLKEESEMFKQKIMSDCPQAMSPSARNSRISALENMLATSSSTLISMASQLSEAEERERVFSGRGRWNQVRSLAEAKNLMNYLFNLVSSSRCQLWDKEVNCREKDSVISELKEKVVRLNSLKSSLKRNSKESAGSFGPTISGSGEEGHAYALRKAPRTSQFFNQARSTMDLLDDMDISDAESDEFESDLGDEDWVESGKKMVKTRSKGAQNMKFHWEDAHASENSKSEISSEEGKPKVEKNGFDQCCSCSRSSFCKTKKCECRAAGRICTASCGCIPSKCSNREGGLIDNALEETSHAEATESGGSHSSFDRVDEKSRELVSNGAMLLQSALGERLAKENEDVQPRKPLTDIGNTVNVSKQSRRKKWRKSTIQLVPSEPLPSSVREGNEAPRTRGDVPLRLPRALDSAHLVDNPPLADRNSVKGDGSVSSDKDGRGLIPSRSPVRLRKATDEKENHMM
ncbi:kinesin-like protein KIN-4C [Cocos nucifera]|uniref:Kinesin-like protein KIN-4C n=1 Tax=Cocos nucifera TaxID=13894 RepID=A0A8K0HVP3_COCNU|nr:kinesin-like protein KIN-4C [Cocos nucifera]